MKYTCLRENLVGGLQTAIGVSSKNVTLPILNNVLVVAKEGVVELTSTNLEIAVVAQVRAKVDTPGSFTVPAKTFSDYIGLASGEHVTVELKEDTLHVSSGKSSTKIKGESAEEFPVIPGNEDGSNFVFSTQQLKNALTQTLFAVSRSDVRPELAGVLFHLNAEDHKGTLMLAATDSYRLSEKQIAMQNEEKETELRLIVPSRTVSELIRILGGSAQETVSLTLSSGQLTATIDGVRVVSRLIDGNYPDYRQIIPQTHGSLAILDKAKLIQQIKAASLFSTTGVNAVLLRFAPDQNSVELKSANTQLGEFESQVDGEVSGDEHSLLLNHRYVLDGLQHVATDKAVFKVVNGDSPCVIEPDGKSDSVYVVMPIKQ